MFLDLKRLFTNENESESFSGSPDFSTEEFGGVRAFVAPVQVSGTVANSSGVVELKYQAVFLFRMPCDRCAAETERQYVFSFEHVLVTALEGEDTGDLLVVENDRLDMDELARADIYLELPTKYLCKPDCKGLCPKCGANWNVEQCGCADKETDPRLAVLKKLVE